MSKSEHPVRLVQFMNDSGRRCVGIPTPDGSSLRVLRAERVYDLALLAISSERSLESVALEHLTDRLEDYAAALESGRVLAPFDHPDNAHFIVSGTGLTHLGSAQSRDAMHAKLLFNDLSDSMKMFKLGLEGGKPAVNRVGAVPEWFYKGDGACVIPPNAPLEWPNHALDGGDETEIVGLYLIGPDGTPHRVGYALGNEYADHLLEKQNYLYLAHSKLRQCSFGPELLLGELPDSVTGTVRVLRDGQTLWESEWFSGESNMNHSLRNLEHHHFKYDAFRRPHDAHAHFFGAAILSFTQGIETRDGDVFEITSSVFGRPLRNPLERSCQLERPVEVKSL